MGGLHGNREDHKLYKLYKVSTGTVKTVYTNNDNYQMSFKLKYNIIYH